MCVKYKMTIRQSVAARVRKAARIKQGPTIYSVLSGEKLGRLNSLISQGIQIKRLGKYAIIKTNCRPIFCFRENCIIYGNPITIVQSTDFNECNETSPRLLTQIMQTAEKLGELLVGTQEAYTSIRCQGLLSSIYVHRKGLIVSTGDSLGLTYVDENTHITRYGRHVVDRLSKKNDTLEILDILKNEGWMQGIIRLRSLDNLPSRTEPIKFALKTKGAS